MMDKFYSALVINRRLFPDVHQVFKPRFNKEYFKRLTANIDSLEEHLEKRCKDPSDRLDKTSLAELRKNSRNLIELKNQIEKIKDDDKLRDALIKLEAIEDHVLPKVVFLPNRHSKGVPESETILNQIESDWPRNGVTKMLSHIKLSYINNCYSNSVVGPNSSYYFGIAAKLHCGIRDYFSENLEKKSFIPFSGLCLTKSAVIEAVNSKDHKEYTTDPCRIISDDAMLTTTHLVEASRESLVGFLTTLGHRSSNKPLRMLTFGSSYCTGSDWFDSDDRKVSQFETIHTLVHTPSIEKYSIAEHQVVRDMIWDLYRKLGLPVRLVHCCLSGMRSNEYDTYRIDIWLPSRSQWIETARISHYLDYITVRTGMKRGHMIDAMIYDSRALTAAIIENNQTSTGKFVIPTVIEKYMPHMEESERIGYLRCQSDASPMLNYQQKRYLVKKNYAFSHSRRGRRMHDNPKRDYAIALVMLVMACRLFIDWEFIYIEYVPTNWKRNIYDYIYRPLRRIYWFTIYVNGAIRPPDTPFDEMDFSFYDKDLSTRRKEETSKHLPKDRFILPAKKSDTNGSREEKVEDNKAD